MKTLNLAKMLEATRLTRAGRLSEAVALLQGALGNGATGAPAAKDGATAALIPPFIDGEAVAGPAKDQPGAASPLARAATDWTAKLPKNPLARQVPMEIISPAAGLYTSGSFSNATGSRSYKLFVPSRRSKTPRPLIVMLHGCTQSADDFAAGTRMNFAAEAQECFVAYPEQPQAANASKCWNWFRPADQARDQGEPALIAGITRRIMEEHAIDARRVYIAGLSAGGAAAAIMGEAYPDLYAAVGVHSGLACGSATDVPSALAAMQGNASETAAARATTRAIPTIVFHGDRDATVHPSNGTKVIARAMAGSALNGSTVRKDTDCGKSYSHSVHRDANGQSILELFELHGAGHAWSGGSPAGSHTSAAGPDATAEMLRFFLAHQRRG